jgi:aminodeoxychorismate synthase component I
MATFHLLEELDLRLPFWRYYELHYPRPYSFLLDSAADPERLGRCSFLGGDPFLVYKAKRQRGQPPGAGATIEVAERRGPDGRPLARPRVTRRVADPFADLRQVLGAYRLEYRDYRDHPVPFLSGAVGYFGYEAGYFIEELPDRGADDLDLPDVYWLLTDCLLAHCHATGKSYLSVVGRGLTGPIARQRAHAQGQYWLRRLRAFEAEPPPRRRIEGRSQAGPGGAAAAVPVYAHFDEAGYARLVEIAREHIYSGDVFEVCTTHRLETPFDGDPWELYQELRQVNPAPFAGFLNFPEAQVLCSSPERFVRLGPDRIAESRPIKGTRPRGSTPEEDEGLRRELQESVKDRAENVMIVDLVRNDFGRVCRFHTVDVPELLRVEGYATVWQLVSTIRGHLNDGLDGLDLVKACFPGGSMTGAPKIEAMKIIDGLEPVKRGIYSGALGYLDFAGPLDLNIVIRTFVLKKGHCYYNVGGAVVADSDPREEYRETLVKARALITALQRGWGRPGSGECCYEPPGHSPSATHQQLKAVLLDTYDSLTIRKPGVASPRIARHPGRQTAAEEFPPGSRAQQARPP